MNKNILFVLLTIVTVYGIYLVSKSNCMMIETLDEPEEQVTEVLPNMTKNDYSIKTEGDFIDFIENMNTIINTGERVPSTNPIVKSRIQLNSDAIVLLSKYAAATLEGVQTKSFNSLSTAYPNMIKTMNDYVALFEMYVAAKSLNTVMSPRNNIDLTIAQNAALYNSQMNILSAFASKVVYFHAKQIPNPPNRNVQRVQNNADTYYY